jgi:hypothetical protein
VDIEKEIVSFAKKDLQSWMSRASRDTSEAAVAAWQQGYISGVQRALSIGETLEVEEID